MTIGAGKVGSRNAEWYEHEMAAGKANMSSGAHAIKAAFTL
jgi:hypothetical protein